MRRDITLKYKLILGSMAAVFIPFFITGIVIYFLMSGSLVELSQEKSLHIAQGIADLIDATLTQEIRLAESIASDKDVISSSQTGNYSQVQEELESIFGRIGGEWFSIFILDTSGIARADAAEKNEIGLDLSSREYFINATKGNASIMGPLSSRGMTTTGDQLIVICVPIMDNGAFGGAVCIPFNISFLADIMSKKTLGTTGYAYLLNSDGYFLTHPQAEFILTQLSSDNVLTPVIQSGKARFVTYEFQGSERIAGVAFMKLNGWGVVFAQDKNEIMAPVRKTIYAVFLSATVFCILTAGLLFIFSGRISTPIQRTMEMLKHLTTHADELVLQIDPDRKVVFASSSYEKITGLKAETITGTELDLNTAVNISGDAPWKSLASGVPWAGRIVMNGIENNVITLETMVVPLHGANNIIEGYLLIARDITNDLLIEKKLQQSQKMEALGTLAGGIAHDFNNILGGIYGYAQLSLMKGENDSESEEYLQEIIRASERARDLVSQILTFSRRTDVELRPLQPKPVVKEALKLLRASTPVTITIESTIASDSYILAEPTQIHQIVLNLITNAVHAIGDKAGTIKLDLEDFTVLDEYARTHPDMTPGNYVILRISDTGCGIEPDNLEHIFEPFFTTRPHGKGTGLGLSVVHGLVKKLGGAITTYSEVGKGTVFTVFFPCTEPDSLKQNHHDLTLREGHERIAIIDDEAAIATTLHSILTNLGYTVTAFTDSANALDALKSKPHEFDLVITDYTMPHLTGLDIKKALVDADIPIPFILMSGYLTSDMETTARNTGISKIISKPVNAYQLTDAIRSALGNNQV
jgi:signal transduction histidine kinase/ActR/RegA family two-component response regulator